MHHTPSLYRLLPHMEGDAKERDEEDLDRVQEPLAAAKEVRRKAEAEVARLEVEQTSILLKLGVTKDEVSSLHS